MIESPAAQPPSPGRPAGSGLRAPAGLGVLGLLLAVWHDEWSVPAAAGIVVLALAAGLALRIAALERAARQALAAELDETRRRLDAIIGQSPSALSLKDLDGRYVCVNGNVERLLQRPAAGILGRTDSELYLPDTARVFREHDRQVLETRRRHSVEESVVVDGEPRLYISHMFPVPDAHGEPALVCRIALDITETRRAQDALVASEARLRAIFAGIGDAAIYCDTGRSIELVNPAFTKIFGYPAQEVIGRSTAMLYADAADFEAAGRVCYHPDMDSDPLPRTLRYRRRDGSLFWSESVGMPVRNDRDELIGYLGVHRDVSARLATERALRDSESRLRLFVEYAPAALAMFDRDMRYLVASHRWRQDYGLGERPLVGVSHYEVFPEIPESWREAHRRGLAGEVLGAPADRFVRVDGSEQWIRWEIRPWRDAGGAVAGIVIFADDISALLRASEEVRRLNAELEQRVEARTAELRAVNAELDSFAYAVSHDLRAPLRALSGFSNALIEDYGPRLDGEARGFLGEIENASRRMAELIDGLLVLSRCSSGGTLRCEPVDLSALAAAVLARLARAEPQRQVEVRIEPGLEVCGDPRLLGQVLENLLDNAWKYTARQPSATIRVYAEPGAQAGERWICVADDGAGFDMANAARLFQPFQRLHRQAEFPGLGIGLATVQRIVRRHGGRIEARSAPGTGAVFRFTLPERAALPVEAA